MYRPCHPYRLTEKGCSHGSANTTYLNRISQFIDHFGHLKSKRKGLADAKPRTILVQGEKDTWSSADANQDSRGILNQLCCDDDISTSLDEPLVDNSFGWVTLPYTSPVNFRRE